MCKFATVMLLHVYNYTSNLYTVIQNPTLILLHLKMIHSVIVKCFLPSKINGCTQYFTAVPHVIHKKEDWAQCGYIA